MAPRLVERWFSQGVYPRVQHVLTPLSNLVPFALLDLVVLAAAVFVTRMFVRACRANPRRRVRPLLRAGGTLLVAAASAYQIFLVLWGLNYRRLPMENRLSLKQDAITREAVATLGLAAVAQMNLLHGEAHREGWSSAEWKDGRLRRAFAAAQRLLADAPAAEPGRLKWSVFGYYFRWAGIDGMVNPFALEVLPNPDLLPWERPFVAAHEWAHLAGYAHEAEANFVGWLTCLRGGAPDRYSGWLYLYWQIASELPRQDSIRVSATLAAGPRDDVNAITERLRRGQLPFLRTASWQVYDQYLRANRVEEGIRSYGEVVTLILRARFDDEWVPIRRPIAAPSR
jgi:hypothetical protein